MNPLGDSLSLMAESTAFTFTSIGKRWLENRSFPSVGVGKLEQNLAADSARNEKKRSLTFHVSSHHDLHRSGRRMIRTTSRCAQRTVTLPFQCIDRFSVKTSVSRARCLPHSYSIWNTPMTRSVDIRDPQPAASLSLDDRIRFSSYHSTIYANIYTGLDPCKYTSGRWLRRDKLERDSRTLNFDFDALRKRVIELCPGASSIAKYEKKEGGYNRIFIFTCDNARRVIARLPTSVAGPARLATNSEVATITYGELETSS